MVQIPWPISECARKTVTLSSVPMRRKALCGGSGFFFPGPARRASTRRGMAKAMINPAPATVDPWRNCRRESGSMG